MRNDVTKEVQKGIQSYSPTPKIIKTQAKIVKPPVDKPKEKNEDSVQKV